MGSNNSNNIPGITDYIPQIQPFQPDYNFYSNVLQAKQSQYDAGYTKVSGLYSSVLNSPMIRDDNNKRRDNFLKAVDTDIKKVSGLDLSLQENVNAANVIFKPFYDDKNIIHDIAFTNKYQKELAKGESFRNCVDPDKCGGGYWEQGIQAMHYKAEEYKNSDPNSALEYSAPKYTPYINVMKKALEAAKAVGFKVEIDHKKDGYIITDTNGKLLLGDGSKAGPLPQFLYGMFGKDQSVIDMYNTQAYVQRKNFVKQNTERFGTEEEAESFYLNNIIKESVPVLEKNAVQSQSMMDELTTKKKILEDKAIQMGGVIKNSDEESSLSLINALLENSGNVKSYHDNVLNQIKTAPNLNDIRAMRSRADSLVANTLIQGTLNTAAFDYAMGTAKREMKADPYDIERFRTAQDIYAHKQNAMTDLGIWSKKMEYEKAEGIGMFKPTTTKAGAQDINSLLRSQGIDPSKATPDQIKNVIDKATAGGITKPFVSIGGEKLNSGYEDNVKVFMGSVADVNGDRKTELVKAVEAMKSKYGSLVITNKSNDLTNATQIQKELSAILQGTGINASEILNGNKSITASLKDKSPVSVAGSFGRMTAFMNDPSSLWGGSIKNSPTLAQTIKNQNAISVISKTMQTRLKDALDGVMTTNLAAVKSDKISQEEFDATQSMYTSMIKDGLFVPQKTAAEDYANKKLSETVNNYNNAVAARIKGSPAMISVPAKPMIDEKALKAQYMNEFNSNYDKNRLLVESQVKSMTAPVGDENTGGATAAQAGIIWSVNSSQPAFSDIPATRLAEAIKQGRTGVVTVNNSLEDLEHNTEAANQLKNYLQQYLSHKGKAGDDLGFTLSAQQVDRMKYTEGGEEVQPGTVYKVTFSPEGAKKLLGKAYDPNQDYAYNVYYNNNEDPNQLAQKSKLSPTDVALKVKGNSMSVPVNGGNITVTNSGDRYDINGTYTYYNPYTNSYEKKNVSSTAPITSAPSKLIDQTVLTINNVVNSLTPQMNGIKQ